MLMFTVEVEKECGCFRKSDYQKEKSFENKDEAILYTESLIDLMHDEFCGKHHFVPHTVNENHVQIVFGSSHGGGCCGGGHCG
jgi:hypothetical protein